MLAASGCGGQDEQVLGFHLKELELNAPLEAAAYVPLGKFEAPATAEVRAHGGTPARTLHLLLCFEMFAETSPQNEAVVAQAAKRSQGALNDALITIIRTSSTEELTDARLGAIKMRIQEAARSLLGANLIRQLVLDPINVKIVSSAPAARSR